jgi:hypothetical protein
MSAAVNLGGAKQRLLPERIALRFFGSAIIGHILAWIGIGMAADDLPGFAGGPGPVLAVVHVLTLGVFLVTAMGASLQMLPVALGRPAPGAGVCDAIFLCWLPAVLLLVTGMAIYAPLVIAAGAALAVAAVILYTSAIARLLWPAKGLDVVRWHVWTAIAALTAAAALAVAMGVDYLSPFLADHARVAIAHAVLAAYGFMGMLALGFGYVLVPMFAVSETPGGRSAQLSFLAAAVGLITAIIGVLGDATALIVAAALLGLTGTGMNVFLMRASVAKRMRKRLGEEFILIRASWAFALASFALALALTLDLLGSFGPALFGFVLMFGWLLTLLVGVLQRILPFLASMHAARAGSRPIAPTRLTADQPLRVHRWSHIIALAAVGAGIVLDVPHLIRAGAVTGAVGAIAFAWFALILFRRTHVHLSTALAAKDS